MELTITEYVPKYLLDYLRNFFRVKNQKWYVTFDNEFGKYFNSLLQYQQGFPKPEKGLTFVLRFDRISNVSFARNYMSTNHQRMFIDYVQTRFNLSFFMWMHESTQSGLDIITSIRLFMSAYGIHLEHKNEEALKKKFYRKRAEIRKKIRSAIQLAVYQA